MEISSSILPGCTSAIDILAYTSLLVPESLSPTGPTTQCMMPPARLRGIEKVYSPNVGEVWHSRKLTLLILEEAPRFLGWHHVYYRWKGMVGCADGAQRSKA